MENKAKRHPAEELRTQRLVLRPFRAEDEDAAVDILQNDEVRLTYMLPDFPTRDAAGKLFGRLMELSWDTAHFVRGICRNDRVIGFLNDVEVEGDLIEVGYVIHPEEKNRGYATEALTAAIGELFRAGYAVVRAGYFAENPASGRVMEKSGMMPMDKTDEIEYRGAVHRCLYCEIRKGDRE